jgi:hypothetical protein
MGLVIPAVGDAGTGYATNISNALGMIDLHNHTSGKGVLVPTAGININADLGFAGFQATAIAAAVFNQLANTTTNLTNQAFTNVLGRPYWRDNSGTIKQVTLAGDALAAISSLSLTAIVAPGTPGAGTGTLYEDSTSLNLAFKNASGVVNHGIQTKAAVSHQWLTSIANDGSSVLAQPAFSDLSGSLASSQFGPLTGDVTTSGYAATLATVTIGKGGTGQTTAGAGFDALANSSWTIAAVNGTTDLSTVAGISGTVTGSGSFTTTGLGTAARGTRRTVTCGAGLTWTISHSAAIVCPGATGLVFSAGDCVEFESLGSGNWQVLCCKWAIGGFSYNNSAQFGINVAGNNLMQFGTGFILANTYLRANGTPGAAGTPQYTYQADTTSGSYLVSSGNVGHSASSALQFTVTPNGLTHQTRHQQGKGASIASATTITLGNDGNVFPVTGTTAITGITTTNWQAGSIVVLIPASSLNLGTTTPTTGQIQTKSGAAVTTVAGNAYMLCYDGNIWKLIA